MMPRKASSIYKHCARCSNKYSPNECVACKPNGYVYKYWKRGDKRKPEKGGACADCQRPFSTSAVVARCPQCMGKLLEAQREQDGE